MRLGSLMPLTSYRAARVADVTAKTKRCARRDRRHENVRHSDAVVLDVIRRHRAGVPAAALARELSVDSRQLHRWLDGTNRGHLLDQIQREECAGAHSARVVDGAVSHAPFLRSSTEND